MAGGMGFNFFSLAAGMAVLYDASGRDAKTESGLVEICGLIAASRRRCFGTAFELGL